MHRKGHKVSRKRTARKHKGGYYSMSGAIAPGAALWTRQSEMGDYSVSNRGGNSQYGAGKKKTARRHKYRGGQPPDKNVVENEKAKKNENEEEKFRKNENEKEENQKNKNARGGRRNKSLKKRKQKGSGRYGGVSASYQGTGSRGIADFQGVITRDGSGAPAQGAFNNHGAQPGSGYSSFVKAN